MKKYISFAAFIVLSTSAMANSTSNDMVGGSANPGLNGENGSLTGYNYGNTVPRPKNAPATGEKAADPKAATHGKTSHHHHQKATPAHDDTANPAATPDTAR